jgi:molybdopterin-guanine dinucleotide biosynthesis protein A
MEMELSMIKPLLLAGGQSSRMGSRKELLPFPDGRFAIEHALDSLRDALPDASSIYISLHSAEELPYIQLVLKGSDSNSAAPATESSQIHADEHKYEHDHQHHHPAPNRVPVFDNQDIDIGPAAGLLAAHALLPESSFLVMGCNYPLLPPTALQQLVLEYESPLTCFLNDSGVSEPLIAIWGPEALEKLKENVEQGRNEMSGIAKQVGGKMVKPLRKEWIKDINTKKEWDEVMDMLLDRERS